MTLALALLAVAALLPLGAVLVHRPQRGVLVLAALVPFDGLLLLVPHPPLVAGWKEALVASVLAATFVAPTQARGGPGRRLPDWLLPAAGLVVLGAVSALVVGGVQSAQGMKIGYFYLLLLWVLWRCPLTHRDRDRLVSVLMVAGLVTAVVGLAQQVAGDAALRALGYEYDTTIRTTGGILRSFSTFNQPFAFGLFLMLVLLIGIPVALRDRTRPRNLAFLLVTPVLVAGLLSSTVRSAILGLLAGMVFLAVHRHRNLAHLLGPVLIAALLVPTSVYSALLSAESLDDRTTGWDRMVDVALSAPFGVGIGATGSAAEKTTEVAGNTAGTLFAPEWDAGYQPDNHYVKTLLELGPLGLWLLVLLLLATFLAARRASVHGTGPDAGLAAGLAATIVAAAAASGFATYFEIFPMDVYFWLGLGVLAGLPSGPARESPAAPSRAVPRGRP